MGIWISLGTAVTHKLWRILHTWENCHSLTVHSPGKQLMSPLQDSKGLLECFISPWHTHFLKAYLELSDSNHIWTVSYNQFRHQFISMPSEKCHQDPNITASWKLGLLHTRWVGTLLVWLVQGAIVTKIMDTYIIIYFALLHRPVCLFSAKPHSILVDSIKKKDPWCFCAGRAIKMYYYIHALARHFLDWYM